MKISNPVVELIGFGLEGVPWKDVYSSEKPCMGVFVELKTGVVQ